MNRKKSFLPFTCAAVFLIVTAGLRFFNIFLASASADVAYNDGFVRAMDILHDVLALAAYGFSASAVVYSCKKFSLGKGILTASLMSAVILADRAFCLIYDITVSNINLRETETLSTAVTWLLMDFLFYAAMYFGGVLVSFAVNKADDKKAEKKHLLHGTEEDKMTNAENKKINHRKADIHNESTDKSANVENSESLDSSRDFPLSSIGFTVGIMTVLQLLSQIVICVQFFMEYDDVTATEKAQMAGDLLWILVEYGGILAALAMASYALISLIHSKVSKKSKKQMTN